jgi:hypothetical protein
MYISTKYIYTQIAIALSNEFLALDVDRQMDG